MRRALFRSGRASRQKRITLTKLLYSTWDSAGAGRVDSPDQTECGESRPTTRFRSTALSVLSVLATLPIIQSSRSSSSHEYGWG